MRPGSSRPGSGHSGQKTTNRGQVLVKLVAIDVVGSIRHMGDFKGRTAALGYNSRFGGHQGASLRITCHEKHGAANPA